MESIIYLRDLKLFAHHGVLPQERTVGAYFILNISVEADLSEAMATDALEATISYADVLDVVRRQMAVPSALLEHVARRIADDILATFSQARAIDIDIMKQNPPMGADCAGAGVKLRVES